MSFEYTTVGFIGLGAMGRPMAGHLAKKLPSHAQLYIFDVAEKVVNEVVAEFPERVHKCASAKEVAEKSAIIVTMVPEGAHVRSVYLDPKTGICATDASNRLLIDSSTIDTATNLAVKDYVAKHFPSSSFYDAPVSGGQVGAIKGTIPFFLGAASTDPNLPRIEDLLLKMGSKIIPCGGPSLGLVAKLSNNYLSGLIAIAASEALNIGMRSGLDPRILSSVFAAGTGQNTIIDRFNPCPGVYPDAPSTKGYQGGFKVQLMRKDFALAVDTAERVGAKLMLGSAGLETYDQASKDPKCRDLDSRVVFRWLGGNEDWKKNFPEES